ncbi:hypothetical protein AB835_06300 [Candidatus Endobugula sertula]|uniref:RDD domain-containing protein n=1 Tax=Candidatus Endobugula sertula TaxID=62101 RepID=A0A1D2QQS2_9GAMM|nr:hypothetical protein AB835_06300 [Candidatus Endobugula sertula]
MDTTFSPSPVWRRFAAIIYDTLLITAISMGYGSLCLAINILFFNNQATLENNLFFQIGWLLVIMSFFCFFWIKAGQTLGMRAWRLKIIDQQTQQFPSLAQCLGRCCFSVIGLVLFFTALFHKKRQCLHDIMTHSMVVLVPKEKNA